MTADAATAAATYGQALPESRHRSALRPRTLVSAASFANRFLLADGTCFAS
jgi:hypothetical protein